ncbi:MAG: glycosyl hydrolase 115 family protein [Alphaproteobacteria bacterium]|nr:glycosyl hydrolase 115 family protein [Alphaproteobacteria bacterium]
MTLFDGKAVASIVYDASGGVPIAKAAELLSHDLTSLSGHKPVVTSSLTAANGAAVVIGLASSPKIAAILKANNISTDPIDGKWETYGRAVIPAPWNPKEKALLIFGSDTRGTIWGVIDLTREMGVSAWEWWADVKIRKVNHIIVDAALTYSKSPSVKYRGIFLNDEEYGLFPWASKTYDPKFGNIGPKTYARIYELMWRLKANTIWPAMHTVTKAFDAVPGNPETAADYAIIHASSHVEMMLRSNPHEWDPKTMGPYNWITNRDEMIQYWKGAVNQWGKYENLYTVGLRGADDYPMAGVKTPEQMADVLGDVIAQQRNILTDVLHKPASEIPQVFTPYKEVLPAYNTGLVKLPGDITLNWPDDNFGYIRRLSDAKERERSGGSGVYYHISYWGGPMSYLWLASEDPALMWEEMTKAYHFDARRVWILNVGDIKPGEFLTQFFLAMAFDETAFNNISSVRAYLKNWATKQFGADHADEITDILWRYYKLAFDRNPEFMAWSTAFPETAVSQTQYNMLDFGDENARRADAYRKIMDEARDLMSKMPADRKAAFFQLVQYPVDAAGDMNIRQLALDKTITYGLQRRESANTYAATAKKAQASIDAEAHYYNNVMEGGKWRGMMGIHPHDLPAYDSPHLPEWSNNGDRGCGWQTEGGGYFAGGGWPQRLATFQREVPRQRYLDFFVTGPVAAKWTLKPTVPWITVSQSSGSLGPQRLEQRVWIGIDWSKAPDGATGGILASCGTTTAHMPITVRTAPANTVQNVSFLEDDGIVSIYAIHADEMSDGWEVLNGLGHTGASLRTNLDMASIKATDPVDLKNAPHVTYRFATATTRGYDLMPGEKATLRVFALPVLPITREDGMRAAVSIDGGPVTVLDFNAAEFTDVWRQHVLSNTAVAKVHDLELTPGAHTVTVYGLDPGLILDRIEIDFAGAPRAYGPVPETRIVK